MASYAVGIDFVDGKKKALRVEYHKFYDKCYDMDAKNKKKYCGILPTPYYEFWTDKKECHVIPMSQIKTVKFGKEFADLLLPKKGGENGKR